MAVHFAGTLTLGTANTPLSIATLLLAAGYTGASGLVEMQLQPTGAGNLVISSDPAIEAEATGFLITPTLAFPSLVMRAEEHSCIQTAELYLLSATGDKAFSIIVTSIS